MGLMKTVLSLCVILAGMTATGVVRADVEATITKARAHLGTEAALEAVRSVHYVGTLETIDATPEGPKPVTAQIEIIFQKPYRQRIVATSNERVEVTALDDYEGWQRLQNPTDETQWRLTLLTKDQIKRLRANTWENLAFFRGLDRRGGRIDDLGLVTLDGRQVQKIGFVHDENIVFFRYFDPADGKLILTETEQGGQIREEGEMLVNGVKFPRKVVTTNKLQNGTQRTVTVTFEKITVNETFAEDLFAVPVMTAR